MKNQIIEIEVNGIYEIYHNLKDLLFYFVLVENIWIFESIIEPNFFKKENQPCAQNPSVI